MAAGGFPSSTPARTATGTLPSAHGYKRAAIADGILRAAYVAVPLWPR